jgi:hypothetical protein
MTSHQRNALQAGIGVAVLGVILVGLAIYNLVELNRAGDFRDEAEGISLSKLLARGRNGNPHIRLLDFSFSAQYSAWTVTTRPKGGGNPYTEWKYVVIPVSPRDQAVPANALAAVVWTNSVNSDAQVNRWVNETTSVRGMLRKANELMNEETLAGLRRSYPGTDFDNLLVLEAGATPPWRYFAWALAGALLAFLGCGAIFYFNFRSRAERSTGRRKPKRPRLTRDEDEDNEDEDDRPPRARGRRRYRDED